MAGSSPENQMKYDWYQTDAYVAVTILAKNMKHEDVNIKFTDAHLSISLNFPEGRKQLSFALAYRIVPEQCSYKLMSTKIEIKLMKRDGVQWSTLMENPESKKVKSIPKGEPSVSSGPPKYPSSNPLHKDWNAIERELAAELEQEKPIGEDGVNQLFQKIYGEGSDEVKRAMNKSYVESGGTVLSTNWKEISKGKVAVNPPNGMEWKKWQ